MNSMKQVFWSIATVMLAAGVTYGLAYATLGISATEAVSVAAIATLIAAMCIVNRIPTFLSALAALFLAAAIKIQSISASGFADISIGNPVMVGLGIACAVLGVVASITLARKNRLPVKRVVLAYSVMIVGLAFFYVCGRILPSFANTLLALALAAVTICCYIGVPNEVDPKLKNADA